MLPRMNRRSLFKFLAGAATLPLVAKLPIARRVTERAGAYFTARVEAGEITSFSVINAGSGYTSTPICISGLSQEIKTTINYLTDGSIETIEH
jgi:hypothetical protein